MLTMFAFLMAVGIVVDDGIVIGENIYAHRGMGKSNIQAAIDGASEVLPSVFSSIATTIIAFIPLFYVSGVMGKFIAVMPVAIILMLLISLVEASVALPGHLSHESHAPKSMLEKFFPSSDSSIESRYSTIRSSIGLANNSTGVCSGLFYKIRFCRWH
jgi:multidrug efflux pump subunit AcrB